MAIIGPVEAFVSLSAVNKFGRPNGFGLIQFGWSVYGDFNHLAGYYQTRPRQTGRILVKMRHYWPPYRNTIAQQTVRNTFRSGVLAWQALDSSEKQFYNDLQNPQHMSGFNRFMSRWIKGEI